MPAKLVAAGLQSFDHRSMTRHDFIDEYEANKYLQLLSNGIISSPHLFITFYFVFRYEF